MATVVVLGASGAPDRLSGVLVERLTIAGQKAIPVHPTLRTLHGVAVLPSLKGIPTHPEVLSIYVRPEISTPLFEEIKALAPGKVIFNPGAENPELKNQLELAGILTENACSLVLWSTGSLL